KDRSSREEFIGTFRKSTEHKAPVSLCHGPCDQDAWVIAPHYRDDCLHGTIGQPHHALNHASPPSHFEIKRAMVVAALYDNPANAGRQSAGS
ncbi:MAG TPA: hypothetical protein DEH78_26020, partial [Solibacterales bacterium]|nr:hypothetical protein [Bryobacterales bacterium]